MTAPPAANPDAKLRRVERAAPFVGTRGLIVKIESCRRTGAAPAKNAEIRLRSEDASTTPASQTHLPPLQQRNSKSNIASCDPQVKKLTQAGRSSIVIEYALILGHSRGHPRCSGPFHFNAMRFTFPHRTTALRVIAVLSLLSGMCLSGSEVVRASCGDYLLMDHDAPGTPRDGQMGEWHFRPGETALAMRVNDQDRPTTPVPGSPCASGRCHSVPLIPPPQDSSRGFVWKGAAIVVDVGSNTADRDASSWGLPADGSAAPQPFLAVDVPPPRPAVHAF